MTPAEETRRHVELLREGLPAGYATLLWTAKDKRSHYVRRADAAAALSPRGDAYVCVSVLRHQDAEKLGPSKRVSNDHAAGLAGLTIDLDVIGSPDGKGGTKKAGAPSMDAALAASRLLAEPTLIVGSGYGVQAWWLFDAPLIFGSEDEREGAQLLCQRWQEAHRQAAGFPIDATHDLARLARLAGTRNHKGDADGVPVAILEDGGPRYAPTDLAVLVADVSVSPTGGEPVNFNGKVPAERVAELVADLCAGYPGFSETWNHEPDRFNGDASAYDMAIATKAVRHGLTDDEVRAVLIAHRLMHAPDDRKAERADYFARTIGKAREGRRIAAGESGPGLEDIAQAPEPDWLAGSPMDPAGTPAEPQPATPGVPFAYRGAGGVIVGPTGGGRSALVQAALYDAAKAGQRCAYVGSEITAEEFDARAAVIAESRGEPIGQPLRDQLARARYLDLPSTIARAWERPEDWLEGVCRAYDLLVIDPLSAVASTLNMDFDKSNAEYVRTYDRLVQPLTKRGVTVLIVDNIGHAEDARRRAKGASAKSDRADLTFSCAPSTNPVGLSIRAQKVRSVRAGFQRGEEWLFVKDSQRIEHRGHQEPADRPAFRPTNIMEKVSRAVERDAGLSRNAICTAIGGRKENVTLALQLLVSEGYIAAEKAGQTHHHRSVKPYREADDPATGSTGSQPGPNRVPDPVPATGSNRVPLSVGKGRGRDPVSGGDENSNRVPDGDALQERVRAIAAMSDEDAQQRAWQELERETSATP